VLLRDSLTGPASQILWEVSDDVDHNEIIRLLRNRFGSLNQMEWYRAELKGRGRKRGETAQSVYQDIKRLMALAFPSQSGEMYEIIARDAFLDSLSDPALPVRVLYQSPKTLDEALTTVLRMDAYSEITSGANENNGDDCRKHVRYVSASTAKNSDSARRIKMLEQRISQDSKIDRLRSAEDHADSTCFQSFQTKDSPMPPVGACGVTTDGRTAWQSAAGGAGQTVCNDVNYCGAEILASSQPGFAPAGHVYYDSPGGATYQPQPQTGRGPPAYGV